MYSIIDENDPDKCVIPEMITEEPIEFEYCDDETMYQLFSLHIPENFGWRLHKNYVDSWGLVGGRYNRWVFSRPPEHFIIKLMSCLEKLYKSNLRSRYIR